MMTMTTVIGGTSEDSSSDDESSSSGSEESNNESDSEESSSSASDDSDGSDWADMELENIDFVGVLNRLGTKVNGEDDDDDDGEWFDLEAANAAKNFESITEREIIETLKQIDGMITEVQATNNANTNDDDGYESMSEELVQKIIREFEKLSDYFRESPALIDLAIRTHTL